MAFFPPSQKLSILGAALLAATACGGNPGGDTGDTTNTSDGPSASETGEAPTTGGASSSTAGSADTSGEPATTADETSIAGTDSGTSATTDDATTGGLDECTLDHQACTLAGLLGDYEDCGSLLLTDDAAAWQAGRDCALAASSEQRAFKLITELQGIDSLIGEAFVGQEARSYMITRLFFDGDPCGGGGCGPEITALPCTGLVGIDDCTVEPGNACLLCDGATDSTLVCGPP